MDSRPALPPMSTTTLPASSGPQLEESGTVVKPPILASDILREEIAPLTPAAGTIRVSLCALSIAFATVATACAQAVFPSAAFATSSAVVTAGAAAIAALLSAPYVARAGLATLAGSLPLALGVRAEGPLAFLGHEGPMVAGARVALITLLPAALFFRGQYRALGAARVILAVALALAVPSMLLSARGALGADPFELRLLDAFGIAATLAALVGFLGPETTAGCAFWGGLLILAEAARQLVALSIRPDATGLAFAAGGALAELVAALVVSLGLYQLLAAALARRARLANVHQIVGPSAEEG